MREKEWTKVIPIVSTWIVALAVGFCAGVKADVSTTGGVNLDDQFRAWGALSNPDKSLRANVVVNNKGFGFDVQVGDKTVGYAGVVVLVGPETLLWDSYLYGPLLLPRPSESHG